MTNGGADKDKDSVYDSSSNSDMGTKDVIPISREAAGSPDGGNATNDAPTLVSWIRSIHVTILSSCPDGYVMVEEDLNPGSSISHLCYRTVVLNKSARAEHISEKDKLAVVEILVKASVNDSHAMDTSLWIESKNETGDVLISAVNVSTSSECPRAFTSAGGHVCRACKQVRA